MPFDSTNAAAIGKKGGLHRKDSRCPRTHQIPLRVSWAELMMINGKASDEGTSRTDLIVKAVKAYKAEPETSDNPVIPDE